MPKSNIPACLPEADPEQLQAILNGYENYLNRSLTKVNEKQSDSLLFAIIADQIPQASETLKASYFVRLKAIGLMVIKYEDELSKSGHIRIHPQGVESGVGIHKSLFKLISNYEIPLTKSGKKDASININIDHLYELAKASIPFRPKKMH